MPAKTFPYPSSSAEWAVGDKVVAFYSVDNAWREGVIREIYNKEAYVICSEDKFRATLVNLSCLKPVNIPEKTSSPAPISSVELKALTPSLLLAAGSEDFCLIARSGAGSRYLQTLVSLENKKLCEKMVSAVLSTNPLRMMTNPASCFLIQKLLSFIHILPQSQQSNLVDSISVNFSKLSLSAYGYHVVMAIIKHLEEHRKPLILKLENPVLLISLLKSKYGTFIAQACVPYMQFRTIISVVNTLLGHVVELGNHPSGTFFVQKFLTTWGLSKNLDLLVENILRHLRELVHHPHGHYVVQSLINSRSDLATLSHVTNWMMVNMRAVYKDKPAVQVLRCLLFLVSVEMRKGKVMQWEQVLDMLVDKLITTEEHGKPLLIQAACHPLGHLVVVGLVRMVMQVGPNTKRKMLEMISRFRASLVSDIFGEVVVKSLN